MESKIPVLCTRPISKELLELARVKNIFIDTHSFIRTEPVENVLVQQEIENAVLLSATVVFTSMNAVEAVSQYVENEIPDWKIYCIGNTTQILIERYFQGSLIAGTANSAAELAELIIEESEGEEIIFFCGDQRRDELPGTLRRHNIEVTEITVYETIATPQKISKNYFGILFFSPSAVESFFSLNKIGEETVVFAIGNTTADAIRKCCRNKILVADVPGKDNLIQKMIEYFGG